MHSDGGVWFTDPTYGILSDYEGHKAEPEQPTRNVYRIDPASGAIDAVIEDFIQPNGLAFSPDETKLYIADSGSAKHEVPRHIRVFDVIDGRALADSRYFCSLDVGHPDGFRFDVAGNLWTSASDGVHCFSPDGTLLGKIRVPQTVSNLTFGGPKKTGSSSPRRVRSIRSISRRPAHNIHRSRLRLVGAAVQRLGPMPVFRDAAIGVFLPRPADAVRDHLMHGLVVIDRIGFVAGAEKEDAPTPALEGAAAAEHFAAGIPEMNTNSSGCGMSKGSPYISEALTSK